MAHTHGLQALLVRPVADAVIELLHRTSGGASLGEAARFSRYDGVCSLGGHGHGGGGGDSGNGGARNQ